MSNNSNLEILDIKNNEIEVLNVTGNSLLTTLYTDNNKLIDLDLSNNVALIKFNCRNNLLEKINIKNNNNSNITIFDALNNANLTCVEVDDVTFATTNWTNIDATSVYSSNCYSFVPVVNIPDLNMKAFLLANTQINTNGDDDIQVTEAEAFTGFIQGNDLEISDLTGIEAFINITGLSINNNNLTSVDLSKNTKLTFLTCINNNLKSLDVTNNSLLETLGCYDNQIKYLNLSNLKTLYDFNAQRNQLEYLNIKNGNNTKMSDFYVKDNPNLKCIQVDDENWSTSHWGSTIDAIANFSNNCNAIWEVYTEDTSLDAALNALAGLDNDGDGVITYEEAQAFTGDLDLSGQNITTVTGLEAFSNAASINISGNSITDISSLLNGNSVIISSKTTGEKRTISRSTNSLKKLYAANNLIEEVDISNLTSITELNISNNKLTYLNLNNNANSNLIDLDVTGNKDLTCIQVDNVIDASNNSKWKKDITASYNTYCAKTLSVDENFLKENISIYPNPASSNIHISISNGLKLKSIEIYNLVGKKILKRKEETIDIGNLSDGIYIVRIKTDKGFINKRFIKR